MVVTYLERIEKRTAFNRKMYCSCGSHEYEVVEILEPMELDNWFVRCSECGKEGTAGPSRELAIMGWKEL